MRRGPAVVFVSLALVVAGSGCGPMTFNRIAVSPDGKTLYMSLNADGGLEVDASSCLYALDVDKGRLRALSGEPAAQGWFSISSDGRLLAFHEGGFEGAQVSVLDLSRHRSSCISATNRLTILPDFVPGERGYVIAIEADLKAPETKALWVAFREGKRFELMPVELRETWLFATALGRDKALVVVPKVIEEKTEQKPGKAELGLYLVDFSGDAPGKPLCVARWESSDSLWALPILSADGGRLAAMVWTEAGKGARVLDIDPRNMRPPKLLFEGETGFPLSFAPDGKGMVVLSPDFLGKTFDVKVWNEADGKQRVVARLPEAAMDWIVQRPVWMGPARIRMVAPSEAGLHVIDVNLDGTQAESRVMPWHKLHVQRCLADIEWGLEHERSVVERKRPPKKQPFVPLLPGQKPEENKPPEPKPDPEAERAEKERAAVKTELAPILGVLKARDEELLKLIEAEWDQVDDWEKVPVPDEKPAAP